MSDLVANAILKVESILEDDRKLAALKLLSIVIALLVLFSGFYYFLSYANNYVFSQVLKGAPLKSDVIGLMAGAVCGVVFLLAYLQPAQVTYVGPNGKRILLNKNHGEILSRQSTRIKILEAQVEGLTEIAARDGRDIQIFSEEERQSIKDSLLAKLELDMQQKILGEFESKNEALRKGKQAEDIHSRTIDRLERELQNQAKRGNVNLVLGILTTITGVAFLGYSVFDAPQLASALDMVSHFLPRISLVLLVEVFAYFFLRLYKQGLSEIKYFQNEIVNIESKYMALHISLAHESQEGIIKSVETLLSTERNNVLEKGQSTIELEARKYEAKTTGQLIDRIGEALSSRKAE